MLELQQNTLQKRQVAYKVRISDIQKGIFTKDELSAGYIKLNNINISRVNIIATVVYKSGEVNYASAFVDDGTGRISLRTFENKSLFSNVGVGDVVLVIGKIREFNDEKYIIPEILKKLNNIDWINVRKLELKKNKIIDESILLKNEDSVEDSIKFNEELCSLIKKLDTGDGVSVDDIIKMHNNSYIEKTLNKLLENGDVFEIKPGKLKVLE